MNLGPQGLLQGLEEHGLMSGRDYTLRYHEDGTQLDTELQRQRTDIIFAVGSRGVHTARAATRTVPIVAIDLESEPVVERLIDRFSRPGENLTGMFLDQPAIATKWLQYLAETVPNLKSIAVLRQPTNAMGQWRAVQTEAARYKLTLEPFDFEADTLEAAFARIVAAQPQGHGIVLSPGRFEPRPHRCAGRSRAPS